MLEDVVCCGPIGSSGIWTWRDLAIEDTRGGSFIGRQVAVACALLPERSMRRCRSVQTSGIHLSIPASPTSFANSPPQQSTPQLSHHRRERVVLPRQSACSCVKSSVMHQSDILGRDIELRRPDVSPQWLTMPCVDRRPSYAPLGRLLGTASLDGNTVERENPVGWRRSAQDRPLQGWVKAFS